MNLNREKTGVRKQILLRTSVTALVASGAMAMSAYAQDVDTVPDAADEATSSNDTIVVTGSRLRKNAFTSPSPLTTLDVDQNRQLGVTSITELLSRSTVANGTQIDGSLNNNAGNSNATEAPPTGGTGSSNISLRNLGPARTLVLMNGRRLAATGVRGAPEQPDIGLIPFSMIERVDIATEAGSSVYGADAVAGTVNVILRNDFEGLEISANYETPEADGGEQFTVSMMAGAQGDRARIIFGAEVFDRQRVSGFQRDFTAPGLRDIEIFEDGTIVDPLGDGGIVFSGFFNDAVVAFDGTGTNAFTGNPLAGSAGVFFFYTPGESNTGVPNFSNITGIGDINPAFRNFSATSDRSITNRDFFLNLNDSPQRAQSDLVGDLERYSFLTNGEVDLDWFGTNNQFYFEAFYFNRRTQAIGTTEQIFPDVPAEIERFDINGASLGMVDNPHNPFSVFGASPIVTLDGVGQNRDVELQQTRFVAGMRGDFPGGWLAENNWSWDNYFTYDRGTGFVSQNILFEPHVILGTLTVRSVPTLDANGNQVVVGGVDQFHTACGIDNTLQINGFDTDFDFDTFADECVPLDFFSSSIFENGTFSTQAETDFATGLRTNRTTIEQYVYNAFVQGNLLDISGGGTVTAGFGYEFRRDIVDSQNDIVGVLSLNAAESPSSEKQTRGRRDFNEIFGEVDIPLVVGKPGIELLNIDGAVRWTDESNFGSDITYRTRVQYRPVDWFGLSGGYGTSFRAPNLRESFLAGQGGGVSGFLDPCIQTNIQGALDGANGDDSDADFQFLVNECAVSGVQFTDTDMNGFNDDTVNGSIGITTIPTVTNGESDLLPETSRTFTITAQMEQPWFEAFDFNLAVSYFDVKISNTVLEPRADLILARCFNDRDFPNQSSAFCSLVSRPNAGNPAFNIVNEIDITFFNVGEVTAKGLDINSRFRKDLFEIGGAPLEMVWSTATSYQLEQETEIFGPADRDDNIGEIGSAKVRINNNVALNWGDWSLLMENRRIGAQQQDNTDDFRPNPILSCFPNCPNSRDVDFTDPVWYHDIALTYQRDQYALTFGVNNFLDRDPPLIDDGEGPNRLNAVSSSGFDFFGRSYFVTGRVNF